MPVLFIVISLVALALFVGKYIYYTGSRKECDDEFRILLKEISLSSPSDSRIMQQKVVEFNRTFRATVSHDFLLSRSNKLWNKIKYPRVYANTIRKES